MDVPKECLLEWCGLESGVVVALVRIIHLTGPEDLITNFGGHSEFRIIAAGSKVGLKLKEGPILADRSVWLELRLSSPNGPL